MQIMCMKFLYHISTLLMHLTCIPLTQNVDDKEQLDKIFTELDVNKDNTIDFKEFVCMVSCVTCICHDFFIKK